MAALPSEYDRRRHERNSAEHHRQASARTRLMKLIFDEEQELLATTVREWVNSTAPLDRLREIRDTKDPVGFSRDVWKQMAALGWTGICLPEEYGGSGLGF